ISMPDGGSVPIVSQTEIDPNENGPFPHARALRHRAQCQAAPRREAAGPGRLVPARPASRAAHSARRRRVLRTPSRSRATARVRGDGSRRARTACEMDARGPSLRARFVFSFEGPTPCRAGSRRVVLNSARGSRVAMSDDRDAIHFPEAEIIPSFAIAFYAW